MASFKSSYSRLARLFEKSRNDWKTKAKERQKQIRALEVKIRDLEKSRAKWKARAQDRGGAESTETDEASEDEPTHQIVPIGDDEGKPPANHSYSLLTMRLSIELQLMHISLRGVCYVLEMFNWALLEGHPTFPCVQNWACRYGLYLLNEPKEFRTDWVFVVDHTVGLGKNKCLVILGISEVDLERVGYCPSHRDMEVLKIEVTELGTGEALSTSLEDLSKKVGVPSQIVADHGSDVRKGVALFQEQHPETIYTYDISHRMATFLKQELSNDPRWNEYLSRCGRTIPLFQQTNLAPLCPPRQRTKARFMQTHHQVRWGQNLIRYYDRGDFSLIDAQFALNGFFWEALRQQFGKLAVKPLLSQVGDNYSDQASLRIALMKCLGERVDSISAKSWELADVGRGRFIQGFEWLLEYRQELEQYEQILAWSHFVQKQLKTSGLSEASRQLIEASVNALNFQEPAMERLTGKTLNYLQEETEKFPEGRVVLASSDIIESVFGTYKTYAEAGPLKEIGKLVLMIPVFVTGVCKEGLNKAMETVRTLHVKEWLDDNCGPSMMAVRRQAFSSL
jgi:hypothetical protein